MEDVLASVDRFQRRRERHLRKRDLELVVFGTMLATSAIVDPENFMTQELACAVEWLRKTPKDELSRVFLKQWLEQYLDVTVGEGERAFEAAQRKLIEAAKLHRAKGSLRRAQFSAQNENVDGMKRELAAAIESLS